MTDTGESSSPARWIDELADKCVSWETCITTAFELLDIPEEDRATYLISLKSQIDMVRSVNDEAKASDTIVKWGTSMTNARYKDSAHYDRQYFDDGRQVLEGEKEQLDILLRANRFVTLQVSPSEWRQRKQHGCSSWNKR